MKEDLFRLIKVKPLVFQSVAIWLIDQSELYLIRRGKNDKKVLNILFYFLTISTFIIITSETLARVLIGIGKRQRTSENIEKYGFIYFAKSHHLVLEKIMSTIDPTDKIKISSRTFKEALKRDPEKSTVYIDDFINLKTLLKTQLRFVIFIFTQRSSTVNFLHEFSGYNVVLFQHLILKLFLSVRFEILANSFYSRYNSIHRIFLGNDTCYRSFWLIKKLNNEAISCTIQHGIPENIVQYYSISNFFMAWDSISLNTIIRNDDVNYAICGYPKESLLFKNNPDKNSILIISTRITNTEELLKLKKINDLINSLDLTFYIKFHPLESVKNLNHFDKENIYSDENHTNISKQNLYVIDTTLGIDLACNGVVFLPLTFDLKRTFNSYFDAIHIDDFIKQLETNGLQLNDQNYSTRCKLKFTKNQFNLNVFKQLGIL